MDLTLIIPTRDRRAILCETLARLEPQAREVAFEVVVVNDGSTDDTREVVEGLAARTPFDLVRLEESGSGPATARNRGLAVARAPVCLFLDDDTWPREDLLVRHRDFHRRRPEPQAALLGRVVIAPAPPPTPFMRWLADTHLGYGAISDAENVGGRHFYSGNVSVKTELVRGVGGFDEGFRTAAHDDIDLGLRLERSGLRLVYDPHAVVEHHQPTDRPRAIDRLLAAGEPLARFTGRHPDWPLARRPGLRHRFKAGTLAALAALGARSPRVQRETWRFLCHEAAREGYWTAVDRAAGRDGQPGDGLRIGRTLARLASRDPDARMPDWVEGSRSDRQAATA
jgi:GT2 family glycosyltransferase